MEDFHVGQGKRKDQLMFSSKVNTYAVIMLVVLIILAVIL